MPHKNLILIRIEQGAMDSRAHNRETVRLVKCALSQFRDLRLATVMVQRGSALTNKFITKLLFFKNLRYMVKRFHLIYSLDYFK